jgi:hypothetical protein
MSSSLQRRFGETLLSACGMLILVSALAAIDDRIRDHASMLVADGPPVAGTANVGARAGRVVGTAVHVARAWSRVHVYLTIFAVAGAVLLVAVRKL